MMNLKKEITEKENLELVFAGKEPAWIPYHEDAFSFMLNVTLKREYNPSTGYYVDPFGVSFINTPDGGIPANTHSHVFELEDITRWRDIIPKIDLDQIDWETEAKRLRATMVKDGQMIDYYAGFVWDELHYMMGFENALLSLALEPEETGKALNAIADFWIDVMRHQCKYLKPEMITFMEHIATNKGLLMSPDTYRKILKPIHKKMFDAVHELGAIPTMHVDGDISAIIEDIVEVGVKAIEPLQIYNDINLYKEKYGLVAIGGWDSFGRGNQADSTEEEVRDSVRLAMDTYGPGGRYIFWESGITPRFQEQGEYLADEARKYGSSFYQKR